MSHGDILRTKVNKEKIPPSWWLSAFRAIKTYLIVVIKVSVQIIKEIDPKIKDSET